jgi:glycolate oxidase FAD binding subunit
LCVVDNEKNMPALTPSSADELSHILKDLAAKRQTISLIGNNSKRLMAGPISPSNHVVSTAGLRRILQYEQNDLTISVEAGIRFSDLQTLLAENRQMIALDPCFSTQATVGGIVASNSSGPMRRAFGTARDLVIGMSFATLEGKIVKTGGMVVKNVAGLDMGKLMIGSFGTLAAITTVNFRVHSLPPETKTFVFTFADLESAMEKRDAVVRSQLQPLAVDLISPAAAMRLGARGYLMAVRAGGSRAVLKRYAHDLGPCEQIGEQEETAFWQAIREFSSEFLRRQPGGLVLRFSTTLNDVGPLLRLISGASVSRAASGVTYVYFSSWQGVPALWNAAKERGWSAVVEFASDEIRGMKELWLQPSSTAGANSFAMMEKIKHMFDPQTLLNRLRLYGRI